MDKADREGVVVKKAQEAVDAEHKSLIGAMVDEGNDAYKRGVNRGRTEVLDFIESMSLYWKSVSTTKHDFYIPLGLADTYQARLKEWGYEWSERQGGM